MRLYIVLITTTVLMAFAAGYLSFFVYMGDQTSTFTLHQTDVLINEFRERHKTAATINLNSLRALYDARELLDPRTALPRTHEYDRSSLQALSSLTKTCVLPKPIRLADDLKKAWAWAMYKCHLIQSLPANFFEKRPYVDPFGHSFVYLALQEPEYSANKEWIKAHISLLHVTEFRNLSGLIDLKGDYAALANVGDEALLSLLNNESLNLGEQVVLVRQKEQSTVTLANQNESSWSPKSLGYDVFYRKDWDQFFSLSSVTPKATTNKPCLFKQDQVCWTKNDKLIDRRFFRPSLLLLFGSVGMLCISIFLIVSRIRNQKRDQARRKFALQTLTHELRTPLASLVVSSDSMLKHFDDLSPHMQTDLLNISNDVQRLKRLAETSRQYLTLHEGNEVIKFEPQLIPLINDYVRKVLEPFKELSIHFLQKDTSLKLDAYWVSVCIKNIVENAKIHGQPPVAVEIKFNHDIFEVVVTDSGDLPQSVIDNVNRSTTTPSSSGGLGLGLIIVKRVIEEMNGSIVMSRKPTIVGFKIKVGV